MKIIDSLVPGSPAWLQSRSASKAPAMMGVSSYQTRNELLHQMKTGITPEFSDHTQRLFDAGHETEALAREIVEELLDDALAPVCGESDDGYLTASFDGLTFCGRIGFEHKLWNESLAAAVHSGELPEQYKVQMDQQIYVGDLEYVIFTTSDGTRDKIASLEYRTTPARIEALLDGWKQFDADLAAYVPVEVVPAAVAAPTLDLPAVTIQTTGQIAVRSNLSAFGASLNAFIDALPTKPATDQEFADCKAALGKLKLAEETLESEEVRALSQLSEIDDMRREKNLYQDLARTTRLALEKLVTARESQIKIEIVTAGRSALGAHITTLNTRLGKNYMPSITENFAGVIKNKRTIASLQSAVDDELARCKIVASEIADRIQINLNSLREHASEYTFLFVDTQLIVTKANDDLLAIIKSRIAEHKAAEELKAEKIRQDERDRIAKEEQERADREAEAKIKAEREAEFARLEAEFSQLQAIRDELADKKLLLDAEQSKHTADETILPTPAKRSAQEYPTEAGQKPASETGTPAGAVGVVLAVSSPTVEPTKLDIIDSLLRKLNDKEIDLVMHYCERLIATKGTT